MTRASEFRPLRILLICPNPGMRAQFQETLGPLGEIAQLCHAAAEYPDATVLARGMRLHTPDAVVLSFERPDIAAGVIGDIEREVQGLPVIGIHVTAEASVLLQAVRAGTREFVSMPFQQEKLADVLRGVGRMLADRPLAYSNTDHIYSFLPSKPGVGATTLAMSLSAAVARRGDSRVLLADMDLSCGLIRFLLKLPSGSIMDAFLRSEDMDLVLWRQTVIHRDGVDLLHSGGLDPQARLDPRQVQNLIDFARKDYHFMCFDMSGNLEQYSLQVMYESKEIFVVCTFDEPSLYLAREKINCLATAGLEHRVSLLLNRRPSDSDTDVKDAEYITGVPVRAVFLDCSKQIKTATMTANFVEAGCPFSKDMDDFTRRLMGEAGPRVALGPLSEPADSLLEAEEVQ